MRDARAMRIPGTSTLLERIETGDGGGLIAAAGRVYLLRRGCVTDIDGGFVRTTELAGYGVLLRQVLVGETGWIEEYRADAAGRPCLIDGVRVERDARGRVRRCAGPDGDWVYGYEDDRLVRIVTPYAARRIEWDADRPVRVVQNGITAALEAEAPRPPTTLHRDAIGRLWTETDADGVVRATWLWDGFFCFARIDGAPGEPVAAAFSLDPTGTPVRIITREGVTRVPRDAFGEALLRHTRVPGLFGGPVRGGRVEYAGRTLDPRAGAFTSPDPCDGGPADPRRSGGWTGTLPVETGYGRYAVCRNDPVGRADPTGLVSWGVILSDLTWSLQNNTLGIFGLDLSINFWTSFFTICDERSRGYFTTFQFETGSRQQTWALLRRGLLSREGRAWTFQHLFHDSAADLDALNVCRVLAPAGPYEPGYYGTVLRFSPAGGGAAAILSGDGNVDGGVDWSRHGDAAVPVFPGSSIPRFPAGGFHLDQPLPGPAPGGTGTLTELEPIGPVAAGTGRGLPAVVVPGTGYGLNPGDLLLLTDAALQAEILAVHVADESDGSTTVIFAANPTVVADTGVRVRRLENAPVSTEAITQGPDAAALNLAAAPAPASPPDYEVGDPLRFSQGGAPAGTGLIRGFETRLRADSPVPDPGAGAEVFTTSPGNPGTGTLTATAAELQVAGGAPAPGQNEAVLVSSAAAALACMVLNATADDPPLLTLDQPLGALGSDGDTVNWTRLVTAATAISAPGAGATAGGDVLTYTPALERTAPAAGTTVVVASDTVRFARTIAAVVADLIVCEQPIGVAGAVTVERMRVVASGAGAIDQDGLDLTQQLTLTLAQPTAITADALRLIDLGVASVAVASSASYATITDATADVALAGGADIAAAAVVWLGPVAGGEFALVRRVIATLQLDREIAAIAGATDLSIVQLQPAGPRFDAQRLGDLSVAVLPAIAGAPWQLPRFLAGQLVRLRWTGDTRVFRIAAVEANGSTLTLDGATALPDPTNDLTVERLDLGFQLTGAQINTNALRVNDPGTGGSFLGIRGRARTFAPAGANVTELVFDVWRTRAVAVGNVIAIVAGDVAHPAVINAVGWAVEFAEPPVIAPGAAAVTISRVNNTPAPAGGAIVTQNGFAQRFRLETGNTALTIFDAPFVPAPNNLVVAVPYRATTSTVSVTVSSGTTLVPDDPEFGELERRQSLVDHELTHTVQSATWGPWLFCWFPLLAFQIPVELRTGIELPKFSPYAKAKITADNRGRFLNIEQNPASVQFKADDVVQVTRNLQRQATLFLEAKESDTRFRVRSITPTVPLEAGPVIVSPADEEALGSVGGLLRLESDAAFLDVPDAGGLTFTARGQAKIYYGDPVAVLKLGSADPDDPKRFVIREGPDTATGTELLVRRENSTNPRWRTFFDIMSFTTGGGLSTLVFSLTWGWVIYGILKLGYAAGRAIFSSDRKHPAAVFDPQRTQLHFGDALPSSLADATHIEIRSGQTPTVRRITARDGVLLTLSAAVPFDGEVMVSPYTLRDDDNGWDWKSYYPAVVPQAAQPNVISVETANGNSLNLRTFDRLLLRADTRMTTTRVTRVNADGSVELEDAAPFSGPERRVSVAHLNFDNPENALSTGSTTADAFLNPARVHGMDWMRVVMDPYGELDLRARFDHPVARWITRVGRWLFGARSWSIIFPGWFFWDNALKQLAKEPTPGSTDTRNMGHLSQMEQEASASSGDLYAPMSRLYPKRDRHLVGDLSRFWFWRWDTGRDSVTVIATGRRDAPGVHYQQRQWPILLPSVTPETGGAAPRTPNDGAGTPGTPAAADPANAGIQLPDALTFRDFTRAVDAASDGAGGIMPPAFLPAPAAFIPSSPNLERVIGAYTAFTRPGTHRLSVQDNIGSWFSAREAHEGGTSFGIRFRQPILYDVTVEDVTVSVGGQTVANDATVTLVATQRAGVSIPAEDDRLYAVGMVRPTSGPVLQAGKTDVREVVAFAAGAGEVVEISRVHSPGSGDLDTYALHLLDGDLHIPVRRITVDVIATLPLRMPLPDAATLLADPLNANVIGTMHPGEVAFLIVPTALRGMIELVTVDGAPPAPDAPTLVQDAASGITADFDPFLGVEGSVLTVQFETAQPLAAGVDLVLNLDVGRDGNQATLAITVRLEP